jgi:hypothetical protein
MTDQEINEAVARRLGKGHIKDGWEMVCIIPDYCHSIAAAWEIVNKCGGHIWLRSGDCMPDNNPNFGITWQCLIAKDRDYIGKADTAPMAICLAFLKIP